jgi:hypothetical protein
MANLALGIVRQSLQAVIGNVALDEAASPPLAGLEVGAQQSCEK